MEIAVPDFVETLPHRQAAQWLERVAEFRQWERTHILTGEPSDKALQKHRLALRYTISMTRMMLSEIADPELHDPELFRDLEGVLLQLNHSWEMIHNPLPQSELNDALARYFPG
jgi:hypothetical protein